MLYFQDATFKGLTFPLLTAPYKALQLAGQC